MVQELGIEVAGTLVGQTAMRATAAVLQRILRDGCDLRAFPVITSKVDARKRSEPARAK
jgi:hypothetical protein